MANNSRDSGANYPMFMLKVNLKCCEKCPKKLEKALLKMDDAGKDLVYIRGNIESMTVVKNIKKLGKNATVIDDKPQNGNSKNKKAVGEEACCPDDGDDDDHEFEDYDVKPREFAKDVCRDRYCLIHRRDHPLMGDHAMPMHTPFMFGGRGQFDGIGYFGPRPRPPMPPMNPYGERTMMPPYNMMPSYNMMPPNYGYY